MADMDTTAQDIPPQNRNLRDNEASAEIASNVVANLGQGDANTGHIPESDPVNDAQTDTSRSNASISANAVELTGKQPVQVSADRVSLTDNDEHGRTSRQDVGAAATVRSCSNVSDPSQNSIPNGHLTVPPVPPHSMMFYPGGMPGGFQNQMPGPPHSAGMFMYPGAFPHLEMQNMGVGYTHIPGFPTIFPNMPMEIPINGQNPGEIGLGQHAERQTTPSHVKTHPTKIGGNKRMRVMESDAAKAQTMAQTPHISLPNGNIGEIGVHLPPQEPPALEEAESSQKEGDVFEQKPKPNSSTLPPPHDSKREEKQHPMSKTIPSPQVTTDAVLSTGSDGRKIGPGNGYNMPYFDISMIPPIPSMLHPRAHMHSNNVPGSTVPVTSGGSTGVQDSLHPISISSITARDVGVNRTFSGRNAMVDSSFGMVGHDAPGMPARPGAPGSPNASAVYSSAKLNFDQLRSKKGHAQNSVSSHFHSHSHEAAVGSWPSAVAVLEGAADLEGFDTSRQTFLGKVADDEMVSSSRNSPVQGLGSPSLRPLLDANALAGLTALSEMAALASDEDEEDAGDVGDGEKRKKKKLKLRNGTNEAGPVVAQYAPITSTSGVPKSHSEPESRFKQSEQSEALTESQRREQPSFSDATAFPDPEIDQNSKLNLEKIEGDATVPGSQATDMGIGVDMGMSLHASASLPQPQRQPQKHGMDDLPRSPMDEQTFRAFMSATARNAFRKQQQERIALAQSRSLSNTNTNGKARPRVSSEGILQLQRGHDEHQAQAMTQSHSNGTAGVGAALLGKGQAQGATAAPGSRRNSIDVIGDRVRDVVSSVVPPAQSYSITGSQAPTQAPAPGVVGFPGMMFPPHPHPGDFEKTDGKSGHGQLMMNPSMIAQQQQQQQQYMSQLQMSMPVPMGMPQMSMSQAMMGDGVSVGMGYMHHLNSMHSIHPHPHAHPQPHAHAHQMPMGMGVVGVDQNQNQSQNPNPNQSQNVGPSTRPGVGGGVTGKQPKKRGRPKGSTGKKKKKAMQMKLAEEERKRALMIMEVERERSKLANAEGVYSEFQLSNNNNSNNSDDSKPSALLPLPLPSSTSSRRQRARMPPRQLFDYDFDIDVGTGTRRNKLKNKAKSKYMLKKEQAAKEKKLTIAMGISPTASTAAAAPSSTATTATTVSAPMQAMVSSVGMNNVSSAMTAPSSTSASGPYNSLNLHAPGQLSLPLPRGIQHQQQTNRFEKKKEREERERLLQMEREFEEEEREKERERIAQHGIGRPNSASLSQRSRRPPASHIVFPLPKQVQYSRKNIIEHSEGPLSVQPHPVKGKRRRPQEIPSEARKFQCPFCPKSFTQRGSCNRHMRKHYQALEGAPPPL